MTLRPYQLEPVEFLSRRKRALVVAPAGSGKTVIAAAALDRVLRAVKRTAKIKAGWLANTKEQCQQAKDAIALFRTIKYLAEVKVRCAAAEQTWADRDVLIVDECHHSHAPEWRRQIETCQGARWGFTATPDFEGDEAENKSAALRELFGDERFNVQREDVGALVSKAKVVLLDASDSGLRQAMDAEIARVYAYRSRYWGGDTGKLRAMVSWQVCVEMGIVGNQTRNQAALGVAQQHFWEGDSVLVLVNQVEHAKWFAEETGAVACYSGMGAKARRHALYDFKAGTLKCIVATSLADEGLDVPRASVLVLVSGGRSKAKAEQRTGRVLRAFAGKETAIIYDFEDHFHPLMAKHSLARQAVYRNLGYEIVRPL